MIDFLKSKVAEPQHLYVVRVSQSQVAVTTDSYFWFVNTLGALSKDYPDASINMLHDKNNYTDPHLQQGQDSATFRSLAGETIHVEW